MQGTLNEDHGIYRPITHNNNIDQANAAAESSGRFFNKTIRFAKNESANQFELRIGMHYYALQRLHVRGRPHII